MRERDRYSVRVREMDTECVGETKEKGEKREKDI